MPANTWAVKVVRHDGLGVLNTLNNDTPSRIVNALNAELDPAVSRSEFTVWAKPESDIYQEFLFNNANFGSEADGSFSIDFIPVGKGELTERQINDLKSQMSVILNGPSSVSSQLNPNNIFGAFTDTAISFINNPQGTKTIAAGLSTKEIYLLIDDLRKVAHSSDLSAGVWDARAAASILSFELSLLLLNDLGPYCSTMEVHLPYTDKTVNTLGLRMAHLYLARALSRVENYRFSQYREFLDQMSRYQNAGLSYSAVRTDPAKMQQMRDAYNILKAVAGDGITPFGAALTEVKFVLSKFKSIGAGQATTDEILTLLSGLSEVEDKFVQDFVLKLREFKSNNHNKVDVTDLKERVARIEREQQQVLHLMRHNVRFLSLGEGADTSSFVSMMQNLISNNVSIFRKPLQFAVFESIRAAYVNNESVNQTLKQAEQCIMENIP